MKSFLILWFCMESFVFWILVWIIGLLDFYMDFHGSWVLDVVPRARI